MHIEKVRVEGFRLLENVEILLEPTATVIVGRNNSGKTSLTEVFDRFAGDKTRFRLEDFSSGISGKFLEARQLRQDGMNPEEVLGALPRITTANRTGARSAVRPASLKTFSASSQALT
jgi:predicted ATP-dependent endonuclease of OLD family